MNKNLRATFASLVSCFMLLTFPVSAFAEAPPADGTFTFEDVKDWQFSFSSGVGAWGTILEIHEDGTFQGNYHDSNMGETGDGYDNGTVYFSNFSGAFTEPEMLNDYTAAFQIDYIQLEKAPGEEEIVDGVRYVSSEPYGLENAKELYMYLPGAPTAELPEDFLSWVHFWDPSEPEEESLAFYGLYNVTEAEGFYGFIQTEDAPENEDYGYIEAQIVFAEEQAGPLQEKLDEGDLSQLDMNMTSGEVFQIWDDCLNNIWKYLKENLDEDTMSALTQEELEWIREKEAAVKEAGEEFEGGSIRPLIENGTAAQWTKERVYELQKSFGANGWSYAGAYASSDSGAVA